MTFKTLITTAELNLHLEDANLVIIDLRFDLGDKEKGAQAYLEGHIPGAVYAGLEKDLSLPASATGGRHPLPTVEALERTFSSWGIDAHVQVVVYDDRGGGYAARLWWMLRYLGHNQVALLDGGYAAWVKDDLPLHKGPEARPPRTFKADLQAGMLVSVAEVLKSIDDKKILLIDSRSPERHQGLLEPIDRMAGHIPEAVNRFWQNNLDGEGHFLPIETLRKEWQEILGDAAPESSIVHCGSGVTGCQNILAMAHAGLEGARLYAGSWSQWLEDPDLPKVLGKQGESLIAAHIAALAYSLAHITVLPVSHT